MVKREKIMTTSLRIAIGVLFALMITLAHAADFPTVGVVPSTMIRSDTALAYLDLDLENRPGWIVGFKGGYQWKFYKDHGTGVREAGLGVDYSTRDDSTKSGVAGSASLGYNFGPRFPLTVGLTLGFGAGGNLNTHGNFLAGQDPYNLSSRQKVRILTLDLGIDYDFKNCSRWTPFVGITGGVAFISDKGKASLTNLATADSYYGYYNTKHRTNLVGGFRAGTKYCVNERITLSLYASYTYLGSIKGKSYELHGGNTTIHARNEKMKAHALDLKAGIKISF